MTTAIIVAGIVWAAFIIISAIAINGGNDEE